MNDAVSAPDAGVSMREALGELYDQMESGGDPEGQVLAGTDAEKSAEDPAIFQDDDLEQTDVDPGDEIDRPALTAPAHWSAQRRELFERADPEIQQAWLDREAEYERGIQQKAQDAATLRQAIEPVKQLIQIRGMDEAAWIRQMAAYTTALEQDPAGVIRAVAQQYGVDLAKLTGSQPEMDEFTDPQVRELREQIQTLQRRIEESQQTAQQTQASQQVQMIEAFRSEKDASGNPLRPHFDAVLDDIMVLAQGYRGAGKQVPALAELYERAVRMRPELTSQQKAQVSSLERAQKARAARSAAVRPASGVANGEKTKPTTLKDELRAAWDQMERGA